jgi:hypothetical protein
LAYLFPDASGFTSRVGGSALFVRHQHTMKAFARLLLIVTTVTALVGCASNWAARNEPVTFIPEVLKAIETAQLRPIKLTDSQRDQLLKSLHGPVRGDFMSDDLQPEVLASWWYQRDKVTFVRYSKDKRRFVFVSYLSDGRLFGSGDGTAGDPPWTK